MSEENAAIQNAFPKGSLFAAETQGEEGKQSFIRERSPPRGERRIDTAPKNIRTREVGLGKKRCHKG